MHKLNHAFAVGFKNVRIGVIGKLGTMINAESGS
jgi:hypothetical protein